MGDDDAPDLRPAVPPGGRAHAAGHGDPAALRLRRLRLRGRLGDGPVHQGERRGHPRAGRRRPRRLRPERRRRLLRRGRPAAQGHRRPAALHLRGQRACCATARPSRSRRRSAKHFGMDLHVVACRRTCFLGNLAGVDDPEAEAQDHRQDLHRRLRRGGPQAGRRASSWRRARSTRT